MLYFLLHGQNFYFELVLLLLYPNHTSAQKNMNNLEQVTFPLVVKKLSVQKKPLSTDLILIKSVLGTNNNTDSGYI